jgi:hypothetical protein
VFRPDLKDNFVSLPVDVTLNQGLTPISVTNLQSCTCYIVCVLFALVTTQFGMQGCLDGVRIKDTSTNSAVTWVHRIHQSFLQPVLQWLKQEGPVAVTAFEVMDIRTVSITNGWLGAAAALEERRQQCASEYTDFVMDVTGVPKHVIVRTVLTADGTVSVPVEETQGVLHLGLLYDVTPNDGIPEHPAQLQDMLSDFFLSSPTRLSGVKICIKCIQYVWKYSITLTGKSFVDVLIICVQDADEGMV